jgi:hypothetical protein
LREERLSFFKACDCPALAGMSEKVLRAKQGFTFGVVLSSLAELMSDGALLP